jgi:hypothetical protein
MYKKPRCPYPNCPENDKEDPWDTRECVLNKPLWMVIPAEGIHLACPVHPEGHHIYGTQITCSNMPDPAGTVPWYQHDPSKDLTYDSTKTPVEYDSTRRIMTGDTLNDWHKFSM